MENIFANAQIHECTLMRTVYLIIFTLFISGFVKSQSLTSNNKKALKYYSEASSLMGARSFDKAFEKLQLALQKDANFAEAYLKLATIYKIRMQDSLQMQCYKEVINRYPNVVRFSGSWYYLGKSEFEKGNYAESIDYLTKYVALISANGKYANEAKLMIENSRFAIEYKTKDFQFNPRPLPPIINQFKQQYFPVLTADQSTIIFITRESDEDIVVSNKQENGSWETPVSISKNINSEFNEGTCSISADGRMLVFTSCMGRKGYGSCDLYVSYKNGNEWSIPKNMGDKINSSAWDSQPSLSADGRTLYFVSNRRGGYGKRDIYVARKDSNGKWSVPKNIGSQINTSHDDISPFIHPNGQRLYFSTNGRVGFGSFDVFFTEKGIDENWSKPTNFGYPINTHNDEVSMYISSDGKKGYYSHEEQFGDAFTSTIYEIDIPSELQVKHRSSYVYGKVIDKNTKEPIVASISLIDLDIDQPIEISASDSITGQYLIVLTDGASYGLFVEAKGYLYQSERFNLSKEVSKPVEVNLELEPIKAGAKVILKNIFFEFDSYVLTDQSKTELNMVVQLLASNPNINIQISGFTDNVGSEKYNKILSENRAKSVYEYLVNKGASQRVLTYRGLGATNFIESNNSEDGRSENRRIEFEILK